LTKKSLLDPSRLNEFDFLIKSYCEILYRWGLYNKRIEMLEFVYEKPLDLDEKFGKLRYQISARLKIS